MAFYSWPKTTYFTPCFTLQFRGESDVNHDFMIPYGRYTSFHSERESLADCLEKLVWLLASHRISSPSITDTCTGMKREMFESLLPSEPTPFTSLPLHQQAIPLRSGSLTELLYKEAGSLGDRFQGSANQGALIDLICAVYRFNGIRQSSCEDWLG